ncbi:serine hydrolase [Dyadobacter sp. CY312]|uniref:serine hydrolase n=1 Tax=Dyadobacter sp. CY312 TaxID=2907303 RepID=UPI001F264A35|nr:serine hydrolase [Dyadobacter sp. CY312]MCE7040421.1 serine hydrolase [Dyadobacter sp. CY312]
MKKKYTFVLLTFLALPGLAQQKSAPVPNTKSPVRSSSTVQKSEIAVDSVDTFIMSIMKKRQVPGLSIAVIQDGKIVKAKGYGFIDKTNSAPVTETTLFQAGSISKSVAAVGALHLVEKDKIQLDEDVNIKLRSWKVPENDFTKDKKVTLRGLLSHTAGLTVHGFPGYEATGAVPSVIQILDGKAPANTQAVRVDYIPGSQWRYSGGGYTVMQQLMLDITGKSFPNYMQETVLNPLKMDKSTFEQPLPAEKAKLTATAHSADRSVVDGRWHIYPEMAAAGLWTTPTDLAKFAISIQHGFAGKPGSVLSQSMTRQMLTDQKNNDGLGVFLQGEGADMRFGHGGRDEGFDAVLTAGVQKGQGVVIMINANDNSRMVNQIVNAVALQYGWTWYPVSKPIARIAQHQEPAQLAPFEGRYELENNHMIAIQAKNNRLFSLSDGFPDEEFVPLSATQFASVDRDLFLTFSPDGKGQVTGFTLKEGSEERNIPRIGPLFTGSTTAPDPDPERMKRIESALKAMSKGGDDLKEAPGIATGTKEAFVHGNGDLGKIKTLRFMHSENVAGRKIQRHGSDVSEIVTYVSDNNDTIRYVIIHLTAEGLVTDCDIVSN